MKLAFVGAIVALAAGKAFGGLGPENVALVLNGDSPDSVSVANEYKRLREIPEGNVIVLHHLSATEFINVEQFRQEILLPVLKTIQSRGLSAQIDCITYSVDIPYSINIASDVKGKPMPQVLTQTASVNGLTYLMDWSAKGDIAYLGLTTNRYARHFLPLPKGSDLTTDEQSAYAVAMSQYDQHNYRPAMEGLSKLLQVPRTDPNIAYNLACCQALSRMPDDAIRSLRMAVAAGWRNFGQTSSDPDLASLKSDDRFQQVLRVLRGSRIDVQPGVGFSHQVGWDRSGEVDPSGFHYMLSTVLGVTAGRGNTVDEIIQSLRRSKAADFTHPAGTIYFERNGDVRSTTREWGFQPAADALNAMGVKAVVEDGLLPQHRTDVAGATIGISDFDWPKSGSTMLPGAIAEHLTSFGGMINKGAGQTPCTEFIRNGASGSSGTVTEPFALQEKFPTPFIHVQYAKGFTLAESFYLSLAGPYQLLIIGDPLCRPWAKRVEVKLKGIAEGQSFSSHLTISPTVFPAVSIREFTLYLDGKRYAVAKPGSPLVLNLHQFAAGRHSISIVAQTSDATTANYRKTVKVSFIKQSN